VAFQDHFSALAPDYARARPSYPPALFEHLAGLAPDRGMAWDCGTGNGQAAIGLAEYFSAVVATDPSTTQLAEAISHPRIVYRRADESSSSLAAGSADIVTAAQSAHWFNLDTFFAEVRRVLRPRGIIAIWCYGLCRVSPEADVLLQRFYGETVGRYWPPERRHIDAAYRSLAFPFVGLPFPELAMERRWTLEQLGDYIRTWSAVDRFRRVHGDDPVEPLLHSLTAAWGARDQPRRVQWPLAGRVGRVPDG
jgi:SAM-dependent methyltransferase